MRGLKPLLSMRKNQKVLIPQSSHFLLLIPFHEKYDTDVNPENLAASEFFNCELRIANCELV